MNYSITDPTPAPPLKGRGVPCGLYTPATATLIPLKGGAGVESASFVI